eukprot:gene6389-8798_t
MDSQSTKKLPPRLMISRMVLENFKSYAGVQEIGPFHKRFSSIVGPNGSGKSNVIDALLFVFGKRAKQLRLNKVSELIHKSSSFPNLDYAKVSVYFQMIDDNDEDDDDFQVIPGSEFVVSRTAFSNNQSKYTVDNRNMTHTEVGLLLRQYGIDLDNNRFLILQGEVELIAMMKPKAAAPGEEGLLEYLEDIIGSNRYLEKIEETSKALETINEQRVEKVNHLKIAESDRRNLESSKDEAEAFIDKRKDISRKQNILYQICEFNAKEELSSLSKQHEELNETLSSERNNLIASEKRLSALDKEYKQVNSEHSRVNAELVKATTDNDAFERRGIKLQEDMKFNKDNIRKFQAVIQKESKKELELEKSANDLTLYIEKARQLIQDLQGKKEEEEQKLDEIMQSLSGSTQGLRDQLEAAQIRLADSDRSVASLQTDRDSLNMSIKLLNARADKANADLTLCTDKLQKISNERVLSQNKLKELKKLSEKDLVNQIKELEKTSLKCDERDAALQTEVKGALMRLEEAKATMNAQQNSSGGNAVLDRLIKAAKKGGPLANAGIRGRLGDLGSIHPDYDVAVSTSCAGYLDYIVVDSTEGGQQCLNYLRDNNIGRASFIMLNRMNEWQDRMNRNVQAPAPRLFDLFTPVDELYRPAFYFAMKDTLVANNLEHAVSIAYEGDRARWRVVTMTGDLIDTSGAMSGGGKAVKSGAMKLAVNGQAIKKSSVEKLAEEEVTPAIIASLESNVQSLENQLADVRTLKQKTEADLKESKRLMKETARDMEKLEMTLKGLDEQESDLAGRVQQLQTEGILTSAEENELLSLKNRVADLDNEIIRVSPERESIKLEVTSLQGQIKRVGGEKVLKAQSKLDSITAQLESQSSSLSKKEVEEASYRKQLSKAASSRVKAEEDLVKAEKKLSDLSAEEKSMERDAASVIQAFQEATKVMEALEAQLDQSTKEYRELKENVEKLKLSEVELIAEISKLTKAKKSKSEEMSRFNKQAQAIRKEFEKDEMEFYQIVESISSTVKNNNEATVGEVSNNGSVPMNVDNNDDLMDKIERLPLFTSIEELSQFDENSVKRDINLLEAEQEKMKSKVNMTALVEYLKKDAVYRNRLFELERITETRNNVRKEYEDLRRKRLEEFMTGFGIITLKLKEMYQMITLGGDAELELLDSLDPFSEGIVFSVRPPKKSWKNISNLSGGEKTLSSLALVFALHHYKPTPLYVMDEIDAALDFKNVSIVANYIKERTKNAQFVIISL